MVRPANGKLELTDLPLGEDAVGDNSARLSWDEQGRPLSRDFGDVYFSKNDGLAETRYVFLHHNHLAEKFAAVPAQQNFIIGETGFGTGLNFLACWHLWHQTALPSAHLHYLSVEKFPLTKTDLQQALALWPELTLFAQRLIDAYPPQPIAGFVRLQFDNISLTLILEEATEGLAQLCCQADTGPLLAGQANRQELHFGGPHWAVDAWLLDGFAPAKNPQMWTPELFFTLARLSRPGTSFATFTAAAIVKQGLAAAGFNWQKVPGFGHKRHMLKGEFGSLCPLMLPLRRPAASWHLAGFPAHKPKQVAVIGAGLAGCHTARALAQKGCRVTVFERGTLAQGGSGNAQGAVYAKLSHQPEAFADFNLAALLFACDFYRDYFPACGGQTGVMQLAENTKSSQQYLAIAQRYSANPEFVSWCSSQDTSAISGLPLMQPGLFFPRSGWLNPPLLCAHLLDHPNIQLCESSPVSHLEQSATHWQLWQEHKSLGQFSHVVLACAEQAKQFSQAAYIASKAIRGQITQVAAHPQSAGLNCVLCGHSYVVPAAAGKHCIGASFNPNSASLEILPKDELENLQQAKHLSAALDNFTVIGNRASLRCVTPDYLPIVGPVAQGEEFISRFAPYRHNLKATIDAPGPYFPNLYINLGHGSRGLTYTPLCAALLAGLMMGEPLPVSREVLLQLHPARFLVRDMARGKI